MNDRLGRLVTVVTVTYLITASILVLTLSSGTLGDTWSDDFDGTDLDARWTRGGIGTLNIIQNGGESYLNPASFTGICDETWYGPFARTSLTTTGTFDISALLRCTADTAPNNLARVEVRLYDTANEKVYSFGWADNSMADNKGTVYLHEGVQSGVLFTTGPDFAYSIFQEKVVRLVRTKTALDYYVAGLKVGTYEPSPRPLGYMEIGFLRYKEYPTYCTPEVIHVNSINVQVDTPTAPAIPSSPSSVNLNGRVNVSWTPPDNGGLAITGYKVFRGNASGNLQYLTTVSSTHFLDTGVTVGQRYHYALSAVNIMGESGLSPETSAVPMTPPGAPGNLQAIAGSTSVHLTWDPPVIDGGTPVIDYKVYGRTEEDAKTQMASTGTETEYDDSGVTGNQTYYYSVTAVNGVGEGETCTEVAVVPGSAPAVPSQPRDLVARALDTQVMLTWSVPQYNGNSQITGYNVYRGSTASAVDILKSVGTVLSYLDTGLTNGQEFWYSISAVNGVGEGERSSATNATPFAITVPSQPLELTATSGDGQVLLEWSEPAFDGGVPISRYNIHRGNSTGEIAPLVSVGNTLSYTDTGLSNGKTYYYRIYAENGIGQGVPSAVIEATPLSDILYRDEVDDDPGSSTWSPTSSMATVIIFAVAMVAMFLYLRKPSKPSAEQKDNTINDQT